MKQLFFLEHSQTIFLFDIAATDKKKTCLLVVDIKLSKILFSFVVNGLLCGQA